MLFRSIIHEGITSTEDLIVLCHEQKRVLVPLPKTYEDAQQLARDVFNLADEVDFETTGLRGSEGTPVRIHSTSWEGISPVLHSVEVVLSESQGAESKAPEAASGSARRLPASKQVAGPSVYSNRVPSVAASSSARERQSPSAKKTPSVVAKSRSGPSTSGSISAAGKEPKASTSKAALSPPGPFTIQRPPLPKVPAPTAASHAPAKPPAYAEEAPTWTDEDEEEIRIPSPTKKRVNRPRVLSDYGLEEPEAQSEEEAPKPATLTEEEEEEEYDELEDAEYISAAPPIAKTPVASKAREVPPVKSGSSSRSGVRPLVQLDAMPSVSRVPEREPSPQIKVEKGLARPAPPSQATTPSQSQSQSQGKTDESFVIMIEYNDDPESRSLFKTRGRHMVSKVLMQACRTFGLEEYYNSARLVLLVEVEGDDGGEPNVYRSVCNRNDTMAQAGAEPDARFVVEIVEGEDDACKVFLDRLWVSEADHDYTEVL